MQVREIFDSEKTLWNQFVASSPTGDLLQSFEWGELKHRSGGWRPIRIAVEDGGRIVGAASVLMRKLPKLNKCIFYTPRGPVCDFGNEEIVRVLIHEIRCRAAQEGAILLKIDPPVKADNSAVRSLFNRIGFLEVADGDGFGGVQPRCVMQLDLSPSIEDLLANCKPKWRYNIRLAEKKGVTIRSECTRDDLRKFYGVLEETAVRGFWSEDTATMSRCGICW
jgi:lipid II:glycine glycyltransferase (peptidoglycan interpeptide bridge formation enzyme)